MWHRKKHSFSEKRSIGKGKVKANTYQNRRSVTNSVKKVFVEATAIGSRS